MKVDPGGCSPFSPIPATASDLARGRLHRDDAAELAAEGRDGRFLHRRRDRRAHGVRRPRAGVEARTRSPPSSSPPGSPAQAAVKRELEAARAHFGVRGHAFGFERRAARGGDRRPFRRPQRANASPSGGLAGGRTRLQAGSRQAPCRRAPAASPGVAASYGASGRRLRGRPGKRPSATIPPAGSLRSRRCRASSGARASPTAGCGRAPEPPRAPRLPSVRVRLSPRRSRSRSAGLPGAPRRTLPRRCRAAQQGVMSPYIAA